MLAVRSAMTQTDLFNWNPKLKAFAIQESVRSVLLAYLALQDEVGWEEMHGTAIEIYQEYAEKFPKYKDAYQKEIGKLEKQRKKYRPLRERYPVQATVSSSF